MRTQKRIAAAGLAVLLLGSPAGAVKHLIPGAYPNHTQDKIRKPSPSQMKRFGSMSAAILGGSSGIKTIAVIIVQFPLGDDALKSGSRQILPGDLAGIDTRFGQMASYYNEVSHGNITLNFRFFGTNCLITEPTGRATAVLAGAYTMVHPMEYYGCGDEGQGCSGVTTPSPLVPRANGDYLIQDALEIALADTTGPTSANFDTVLILHAGNGNETTVGTIGDIWSIFYEDTAGDPVITTAGAGFTSGIVFPHTEASGYSPLGVMCHEFGHDLGLPDLYNTTAIGGTSVVGDWDLMDSGPYAGNGANPSHLGAWGKQSLGWVTPTVVTSGTVTIGYAATDPPGMIKIPLPNGLAQEYFLVEYRSKTAAGATFDQDIPGSGLLVWHVDDAITSARGIDAVSPYIPNTVNTGSPHYGVSIVPADGLTITNANTGTAGNVYTNGTIFISPRSDNFAGDPSGVSIVDISGVGTAAATLEVVSLPVTPDQHILKAINYPNPAGKGYAHASGEGHTTLQLQLSRGTQNRSINIYTLSADLVRKAGTDLIRFNSERSKNLEKWVYEYEWDLKNESGAHVAPGVYLYIMRADGESKSGKIVVIR